MNPEPTPMVLAFPAGCKGRFRITAGVRGRDRYGEALPDIPTVGDLVRGGGKEEGALRRLSGLNGGRWRSGDADDQSAPRGYPSRFRSCVMKLFSFGAR
jgi:hypothetical protein